MAISRAYYQIIREAHVQGLLPGPCSILEFGEANWYGDLSVDQLQQDIATFVNNATQRQVLLSGLLDTNRRTYAFDLAKVFYSVFFSQTKLEAIDLHGTSMAKKLDLNTPIWLGETFDVTINNGTAEHIFNLGRFFETMHDHTRPGGLMIHESPFTGWFNHGFFNLQPTLYYDLLAANQYRAEGIYLCQHVPSAIRQIHHPHELLTIAERAEVPDNSVLICLLRKMTDARFRYPMQGYYAGSLDARQIEAWRSLRGSSQESSVKNPGHDSGE